MFPLRRINVNSLHICASVAECREQKTPIRHSGFIVSAHRAHGTNQKAIYFLGLPLFRFVASFYGNVIISLKYINAIGKTWLIPFPYVLV